jgi:hypothetical protein
MADLKISALPASTTPLAGTEILPIVQSATTRQVSVANLTAGRAVSALSLTSTNDATINGVTVGRGGGSVSLNTAVGANALAATSTGDSNAAFGASALASNLGGIGNTATGFTSLRDNTSGNYNVASGYLALGTNLSGSSNVGIGFSVLSTATATSNNTAIGYEALKVASGSTNTAIGYQSGVAMTTGTKNVILGSYSGNTGTLDIRTTNNNIVLSDGDGNVRAWWDNANARFYGTLLATGITNSALTSGRVTFAGASGLLSDSSNFIWDNTNARLGIGTSPSFKLHISTTGNASSQAYNVNTDTGAGVYVGYIASTDKNETALRSYGSGFTTFTHAGISLANFTELWAGVASSTGPAGMLLGVESASPVIFATNNTEKMRITSAGNVGIGTISPSKLLDVNGDALIYGLNVGRGSGAIATNTVLGASALSLNSTGSQTVAIGENALGGAVYTGNKSIAIGNAVLYPATSASNNTGIGYNALRFTTIGGSNTAIGTEALRSNDTASSNTAVGYQAGYSADTGGGNTFVGISAGSNITSGQNGLFVGNTAQASSSSVNNELVIGSGASFTGKGASTGFITPNGGGVYQGNNSAAWSITSDARLKKNIVDNNTGLDKINAIQVRNFEYRIEDEITDLPQNQAIKKEGVQLGAIAQELQQIFPDCVKSESTGVMSVDTTNLTWYMINAIKELKAEVDLLKQQLNGA